MSRLAMLLAVVALVGAASADFTGHKGSVRMSNGKATYIDGVIDTTAAAYGAYDDASNHPSNFGVLKLEASAAAAAQDQYYAAGYLEGVLTGHEIYDMYTNLISTWPILANGAPKNLSDFLATQDTWMRAQIKANPQDPYWVTAGLVLAQYDGLIDGYHSVQTAGQELSPFAFFVLNGCGDLFDLIPLTCPSERPDFEKMTPREIERYTQANGHCSALIKLTGDFKELFMSHSSWFRYQAMTRIMKHYNLPGGPGVAKKLSFSSYPGYLESLDDFYLMDSGLVMLQTTNNVFNMSLQQYILPQTLFAWMRVRIACAVATDGHSWSVTMGKHNSGTYNNQYMVIDLNKFTPGKPLLPGTLYVSEQIPGHFVYEDQTEVLSRGYWASYNVPALEEIYDLSGYPAMVAKYGTDQSYQLAPRAKIFRRDQGKVVDLESFKAIMRYNDYKVDPYSAGDPCKAICCRGDLGAEPQLGGCYDTKVTTYSQALLLQSEIINGPTTSHNLPPFSWAKFPNTTHVGMPDTFNFTFEAMDPKW